MNSSIVVGLGYGDEGKGLLTDYLSSQVNGALVVRFNGGQQAGHTVKHGDKLHIFANLGSGTFRGHPTFWSRFCSFSPQLFLEEWLEVKTEIPFFIDADCPVTTHLDILFNRAFENTLGSKRHGSCGLGFGTTMSREASGINLRVKDLFGANLWERMSEIKKYYRFKINVETAFDFDKLDSKHFYLKMEETLERLADLKARGLFVMTTEEEIFKKQWDHLIFEGAQGILLDPLFGEVPHVTKSNTTSRNAFEILNRNHVKTNPEVFYVTRAYQTRHGAGKFRNTPDDFKLLNTEDETNVYNEYQGTFKKNYLDLDQLKYSLNCDNHFSKGIAKNLMMTCVDQLPCENLHYFEDGNIASTKYYDLHKNLPIRFSKIFYSFGATSNDVREQQYLNRF